jgi:hypothetical protein
MGVDEVRLADHAGLFAFALSPMARDRQPAGVISSCRSRNIFSQ